QEGPGGRPRPGAGKRGRASAPPRARAGFGPDQTAVRTALPGARVRARITDLGPEVLLVRAALSEPVRVRGRGLPDGETPLPHGSRTDRHWQVGPTVR